MRGAPYVFCACVVVVGVVGVVATSSKVFDDATPFLNHGAKKVASKPSVENAVIGSKIDVLGAIFRRNVERIKSGTEKVDLVFLIDASSSVGETNFNGEIKFVKNLLSDFTVSYETTRVAIVTFSSQDSIIKNVDQITNPSPSNNKCVLLKRQLNQIRYTGGGTYTIGAFRLAEEILSRGRVDSKKVIFLITDGFSNGGDPVPIANELKKKHVTIFTLGIKNGNYKELYDLSTQPGEYFSYLLDSYREFESLARRALHSDLYNGEFVPTSNQIMCNGLCDRANATSTSTPTSSSCCDKNAICTCGLNSGQYSCQCRHGYYGSGLRNSCNLCANGTYSDGPNLCKPCPDINHVTMVQPALNVSSCVCKAGYKTTSNQRCEIITCPELKAPLHGYFVKKSECSNILNNACGVRCQIGYRLVGDSIRLCQSNATWSGVEPRCEVKMCPPLKAPKNGAIECFDEDDAVVVVAPSNGSAPVDTQCRFRCDLGFSLVGSKTRNCLPVSKWDGLNTYCKQIRCGRLPKIQHGAYVPKVCAGEKQQFGQTCEVVCRDGFTLRGPAERTCVGKYGQWSEKAQSVCEDHTPPVLECPARVLGVAAPGKNHGLVDWAAPNVTDNSGLNVTVWTKPALGHAAAFKFKIGVTDVTYVAVDAFKNRATCTIRVQIDDVEPPVFEGCVDPPTFLSNERTGANVSWDEPSVYDNSRLPVTVSATVGRPTIPQVDASRGFGFFPVGTTPVAYTATDASNNTAVCVLNVTVQESRCDPPPDPPYGRTVCDDRARCVIACHEGYAFAIEPRHVETRRGATNDTHAEIVCSDDDPIWYVSGDGDDGGGVAFPDCTVTEMPAAVVHDGVARLETDACVAADLVEEFSNAVRDGVADACAPDVECTLSDVTATCADDAPVRRRRTEPNTQQRQQRRRKQRVDVAFRVTARATSPDDASASSSTPTSTSTPRGRHVSFERFQRIRERIRHVNRTRGGDRVSSVDVRTAVSCRPGFVAKLERCVRCPRGTFQNATRNSCQSCPIGAYNDRTGRTECAACPALHSTRRIHSKSVDDCKAQCPPGTKARRRTPDVRKTSVGSVDRRKHRARAANPTSLAPFCVACPLDHYQDAHGRTDCVRCPPGLVTASRGSTSPDDCAPPDAAVCWSGICNRGECVLDAVDATHYSCECSGDYVGSNCETAFDSCASAPCLNGATCVSAFDTATSASSYACVCGAGYTGANCERYDDRCVEKTCKNGGNCTRGDDGDEVCTCEPGFVGAECDVRVLRCSESSCSNGGTCVERDDSFACVCVGGFIGRRCDALPCDFVPCARGSVCVDLVDANGTATRDSYACECPDGYAGVGCVDRIDRCASTPCLNGATCTSTDAAYECECVAPFGGRDCATRLDPRYALAFPRSGTTDYVRIDGPKRNLTQISVCVWIKTDDAFNYGTIFSYATESHDNAFTATDYNGIVLYVNGEYRVTDIDLNDGRWHFFCVTWDGANGTHAIYVDGVARHTGAGLADGTSIQAGGQFVVGQEQDNVGGMFSQSESFLGRIANLDVWSATLDRADIVRYMDTCDEYYGTLIHWGEFRGSVNGDVKILDWTFCGACPTPNRIYNGRVVVENGTAVYYCDVGYAVEGGGDTYTRTCTKTSGWSGDDDPTCSLISCGFPGRIANGHVVGASYYYGDVVAYACESGYELVGMRERTCLSNGTWSYMSPYCMGSQCEKLATLPADSDATVLSEQQYDTEFESLRSSYDVGTQIEFECADGTTLVGESIITCVDNGTWDADPPVCERIVAPTSVETTTTTVAPTTTTTETVITTTTETASTTTTETASTTATETATTTELSTTPYQETDCMGSDLPAEPPNGYYVDDTTTSDVWSVGSTIQFKCRNGFRLAGNGYIECTSNGTWTDIRRRCTPVQCPSPPHHRNMRVVDKPPPLTPTTPTRSNDATTTTTTYYFGNMVTYACVDGHEMYGNGVGRCLSNGRWSRVTGKCAKVSCGRPSVPAGAVVVGDSYLYQDKLKVECPPHASKTYVIVQCSRNRTWTPAIDCS